MQYPFSRESGGTARCYVVPGVLQSLMSVRPEGQFLKKLCVLVRDLFAGFCVLVCLFLVRLFGYLAGGHFAVVFQHPVERFDLGRGQVINRRGRVV